jgi:hypothetical protein
MAVPILQLQPFFQAISERLAASADNGGMDGTRGFIGSGAGDDASARAGAGADAATEAIGSGGLPDISALKARSDAPGYRFREVYSETRLPRVLCNVQSFVVLDYCSPGNVAGWRSIFLSVRFANEGQLAYENRGQTHLPKLRQ